MTTTWILIANSSTARLFTAPKAKLFNGDLDLEQVDSFDHPESRYKTADLTTDISRHNNFVESSDPKAQESERFARELADELESGRVNNCFDELVIAAPPQFHGLIKKHMNSTISKLVFSSIEKDYTKTEPKQLAKHLSEYM